MEKFELFYREAGYPLSHIFTQGGTTGWDRKGYLQEMRLLNAIIDIIAYKRKLFGGQIKEHQDNIWHDLIIGYFQGDYELLESLLKEADGSGKLKNLLQVLKPLTPEVTEEENKIRRHIKQELFPQYRRTSIPKKLD